MCVSYTGVCCTNVIVFDVFNWNIMAPMWITKVAKLGHSQRKQKSSYSWET